MIKTITMEMVITTLANALKEMHLIGARKIFRGMHYYDE
jgi:hypothetical protein